MSQRNISAPSFQSANSRMPMNSPTVISSTNPAVSGISGRRSTPRQQRPMKCQHHARIEPFHTPPSRCRITTSRSQMSASVSRYSAAASRQARPTRNSSLAILVFKAKSKGKAAMPARISSTPVKTSNGTRVKNPGNACSVPTRLPAACSKTAHRQHSTTALTPKIAGI